MLLRMSYRRYRVTTITKRLNTRTMLDTNTIMMDRVVLYLGFSVRIMAKMRPRGMHGSFSCFANTLRIRLTTSSSCWRLRCAGSTLPWPQVERTPSTRSETASVAAADIAHREAKLTATLIASATSTNSHARPNTAPAGHEAVTRNHPALTAPPLPLRLLQALVKQCVIFFFKNARRGSM